MQTNLQRKLCTVSIDRYLLFTKTSKMTKWKKERKKERGEGNERINEFQQAGGRFPRDYFTTNGSTYGYLTVKSAQQINSFRWKRKLRFEGTKRSNSVRPLWSAPWLVVPVVNGVSFRNTWMLHALTSSWCSTCRNLGPQLR